MFKYFSLFYSFIFVYSFIFLSFFSFFFLLLCFYSMFIFICPGFWKNNYQNYFIKTFCPSFFQATSGNPASIWFLICLFHRTHKRKRWACSCRNHWGGLYCVELSSLSPDQEGFQDKDIEEWQKCITLRNWVRQHERIRFILHPLPFE